MKKEILLILILLIFLVGCIKEEKVCFKKDCFKVEISDSENERIKGLMYIEKLDENKGMLFVFDKEDYYPFWMKNVLIPLDIIWLNKDKEVVYISKNVQLCKEDCTSINPNANAMYVLEVNAGISDKIGLKEGDKLEFKV